MSKLQLFIEEGIKNVKLKINNQATLHTFCNLINMKKILHRSYKLYTLLIITILLIGCGAVPGSPQTPETDQNLPAYIYLDSKGNRYDLTSQKLIYTPVSEENTVDGVDDEGYYTNIKITRNEYNKIAAAMNGQLNRVQRPQPNRDPLLPIPRLIKEAGAAPEEKNLDRDGVLSLNHVLEPFLADQ